MSLSTHIRFRSCPSSGCVSLALLQAIAPDLWHKHEKKFVAGWSLLTLLTLAVTNDWTTVGETIITTALDEYIPFIVLIATLTIVAGGIRIAGYLHGNPLTNLALIGAGPCSRASSARRARDGDDPAARQSQRRSPP